MLKQMRVRQNIHQRTRALFLLGKVTRLFLVVRTYETALPAGKWSETAEGSICLTMRLEFSRDQNRNRVQQTLMDFGHSSDNPSCTCYRFFRYGLTRLLHWDNRELKHPSEERL